MGWHSMDVSYHKEFNVILVLDNWRFFHNYLS